MEEIGSQLPELPDARRERFVSEYNLPLYDANLLTSSREMADYFEGVVEVNKQLSAKEVSNWILGEVSRIMNAEHIEMDRFRERVSPEQFGSLLVIHAQGAVNASATKFVLDDMFQTGKDAAEIIQERGLSQISDSEAIEAEVVAVIKNNSQAVADYRAGKTTALKFLVGQVMKATRGRANPNLVNELIKKRLEDG